MCAESWAEAADLLLPFPSISFICSWRLEGTGFLPDRRPSEDAADDVPDTEVPETEAMADVSGLLARGKFDKGDRDVVVGWGDASLVALEGTRSLPD